MRCPASSAACSRSEVVESIKPTKGIMNLNRANCFSRASLLTALTLTLAACDVPEPEEPLVSLEERVNARWQYVVDRDFVEAWEFYSPGYRETHPRAAFVDDMASRQLRYLGGAFKDASCEGDRCTVQVEVTYQLVAGARALRNKEVRTSLQERWIWLDNRWWFVGT